MTTILGAVLSLAVIIMTVVLVSQIRSARQFAQAEAGLAKIRASYLDDMARQPRAGRQRLKVLPGLGRRWRPYRSAAIACSGLLCALATSALFISFSGDGAAPVANNPAVVQTVTTTVTREGPQATITRTSDGTITATKPSGPVTTTTGQRTPETAASGSTGAISAHTGSARSASPEPSPPSPDNSATPIPVTVDTGSGTPLPTGPTVVAPPT